MIIYTVTEFNNPAYGLRSPDNRWHYKGVSCVDTLSEAKEQIRTDTKSEQKFTRTKVNGKWLTILETSTSKHVIECHTV